MKRIFIIPALMLGLTACNAPGLAPNTPADYTSLYNANMKAELAKINESLDAIYGVTRESTGTISSHVELAGTPNLEAASVDFSSNITSVVRSNLASLDFVNPKLHFTGTGVDGKTAKINASADVLSIFGTSFSNFLKLVKPQVSIEWDDVEKQKEEIAQALEKFMQFDGKWIDLTNTAELPIEAKTLISRLATLSMSDVEKYLTQYHIITPTAESTQVDSKYTFPVALNIENTVALLDAVSTDFTGSGLVDKVKTDIRESLSKIKIDNATVTFDSKDPLYSHTKATISHADFATQKFNIDASRIGSELSYALVLMDGDQEKGAFNFKSISEGKNSQFEGKAFMNLGDGNRSEILAFNGQIVDKTLKTLTAKVSAIAGVANLEYVHKEKFNLVASVMGDEILNVTTNFNGENFEGKAILRGIEVATWKAEIAKKVLNGLKIVVQDISAMTPAQKPLLDINLVRQENNDMITGPVKVALAGEDVGSANLSLQIEGSEKFGIIVQDIMVTNDIVMASIPVKKFQLFATSKTTESNKELSAPTDAVPMSEVEKALGIDSTSYDVTNLELTDESALTEEALLNANFQEATATGTAN